MKLAWIAKFHLIIFLGLASHSAGVKVLETTTEMANVNDTDINASLRNSAILDEIVSKSGYDTKIRPLGQNGSGPVNVYVELYLRNIENVDDYRMEYTVQLTYRQSWHDARLRFDHIARNITFLHLADEKKIWMPDVFFENEKKARLHQLVQPNIFTRIYPEGGVLQSYRLTLLLSCPMDLSTYPLDIQRCPFMLSTYGYTTRDIILDWNKNNPVQYKTFRMPQFLINSYKTLHCSVTSRVGSFSCLFLQIEFERAFGFFLIQYYIPCAMVVLVSWVGFWLEPTAIEARVSLGVTTILTIVSQTYGINQTVPPASYIKALDIWTAICQILIFGALIQFALVNYKSKLTSPTLKKLHSMTLKGEEMNSGTFEDTELEILKDGIEKAKRIDRISRVLFPLIFLTFNVLYWTSYGIFH